ncbi:MAG: hypothetical protein V1708_03360 [Candidatus Micrarchaeota archaeon]
MKNKVRKKWGENMIKISVQFWTNNLPKGADDKTAWGSGAIHMIANESRGLSHNHVFFTNMEDFFPKLNELLNRNGVKLIMPPEKYVPVDFSRLSAKGNQGI